MNPQQIAILRWYTAKRGFNCSKKYQGMEKKSLQFDRFPKLDIVSVDHSHIRDHTARLETVRVAAPKSDRFSRPSRLWRGKSLLEDITIQRLSWRVPLTN